ncbi:Ig-like domain-containing protein [Streptomyces calidiresistens]|uniref:L,D-transpeptidase family protein n=1 Tax=Streptomyces calidiresistens TaxID=1485586 RepID=A0A7W3T3C4_9ACTN|nr:Ig-like domain-containing protein [Streptomyces calidiresistens]MBB0230179.1 L,D-transpeptidase family protein [Streptomyces calidiresistens]
MSHGKVSIPGAPRRAPALRRARRRALILAPLLACALAACTASPFGGGTAGGGAPALNALTADTGPEPLIGPAAARDGGPVDPAETVTVSLPDADGFRITDVLLEDEVGRPVPGKLSTAGDRWRSTAPLVAGSRYTLRVSTEAADGSPGRREHTFRTRDLADLDTELLEVTLGPSPGTYGVGQPVTARLSEGIADRDRRAVVERALRVESRPDAGEGSWYWVEDDLLHYRPREYWPANAEITVSADLEGVPLGEGLRGGPVEELRWSTGDRVEALGDISSLTLTVRRNGEVIRTMPMTTGKEGFRTRNGKKVILGRESHVRMRGSSIGISPTSSEYYDLDVYWAARLTWSGEYVHGAPWSVGYHGRDNVSHGCTGLNTENARWFFENVRVGDIVEHVGGEGVDMPYFGNGFGDWNMDWEEWRRGSALVPGGEPGDTGAGTGDTGAEVVTDAGPRAPGTTGNGERGDGSERGRLRPVL